jgi:hypothetical protein
VQGTPGLAQPLVNFPPSREQNAGNRQSEKNSEQNPFLIKD